MKSKEILFQKCEKFEWQKVSSSRSQKKNRMLKFFAISSFAIVDNITSGDTLGSGGL